MKVAFDTSPLAQTRAGTARVVRALVQELRGRPGLELSPVAFSRTGRVATVVRDTAWYLGALPLLARGADVLHCPTFRAPLRAQVPVVVTVHDLALLRLPAAFPPWHRLYGRGGLRAVVRAADAVVAVSEFTKRETVDLLGVPPERVRVVPNAVDDVFVADGPAATDGRYALAVGTLEPRKNLARTVAAAKQAGIELRVVGGSGWGGVDVPGRLGWVADEELARLYRGAVCLVYPSLYEGFGIPVLEALACGCPVVTSVGGACAETAGDAAVLVDPSDVDAIAAGILEAERQRDELRARGLERARAFSWSASADALEALWRELA